MSLPSSSLYFAVTKFQQLGFPKSNHKPQSQQDPHFSTPNCLHPSNSTNSNSPSLRNARSLCLSRRPSQSPSEASGFPTQLGFKEESENLFDLESKPSDETQNGIGPSKEANATSLGSDFLEPKSSEGEVLEKEEGLKRVDGNVGLKKVRQLMKRSSILAKQVFSIESALSLGFVSQLWVNTTSWMVMFVEVRRNLLSGECERFLLEDVIQVGDVVLVEDESVIENEFKMVGLETLVGYEVVTPGRRTIGKVRGYSFNINSGAVESLELDSFGIAIIPSSLVSTYALFVEDVLEVVSDAVIVHEAAASRIYRLTKGFLDNQNAATSIDDIEEYSDFERPVESDKRSRRSSGNQKFRSRKSKTDDALAGAPNGLLLSSDHRGLCFLVVDIYIDDSRFVCGNAFKCNISEVKKIVNGSFKHSRTV